eukprot:313594-Prymnesium_polylepis.1
MPWEELNRRGHNRPEPFLSSIETPRPSVPWYKLTDYLFTDTAHTSHRSMSRGRLLWRSASLQCPRG